MEVLLFLTYCINITTIWVASHYFAVSCKKCCESEKALVALALFSSVTFILASGLHFLTPVKILATAIDNKNMMVVFLLIASFTNYSMVHHFRRPFLKERKGKESKWLTLKSSLKSLVHH
jgi:hypothetical protein